MAEVPDEAVASVQSLKRRLEACHTWSLHMLSEPGAFTVRVAWVHHGSETQWTAFGQAKGFDEAFAACFRDFRNTFAASMYSGGASPSPSLKEH